MQPQLIQAMTTNLDIKAKLREVVSTCGGSLFQVMQSVL